MGYQAIEIDISVPLHALSLFLGPTSSSLDGFHDCFKALGPLQQSQPDQFQLHVQWNLAGRIDWGTDFHGNSPADPLQPACETSFLISNQGLLALEAGPAHQSRLRIEVLYEPLADPEVWQLYVQLFTSPEEQIRDDLERLKEKLEAAYLQQVFDPPPATAAPAAPVLSMNPAA